MTKPEALEVLASPWLHTQQKVMQAFVVVKNSIFIRG